jgi:hypothetical protein
VYSNAVPETCTLTFHGSKSKTTKQLSRPSTYHHIQTLPSLSPKIIDPAPMPLSRSQETGLWAPSYAGTAIYQTTFNPPTSRKEEPRTAASLFILHTTIPTPRFIPVDGVDDGNRVFSTPPSRLSDSYQ